MSSVLFLARSLAFRVMLEEVQQFFYGKQPCPVWGQKIVRLEKHSRRKMKIADATHAVCRARPSSLPGSFDSWIWHHLLLWPPPWHAGWHWWGASSCWRPHSASPHWKWGLWVEKWGRPPDHSDSKSSECQAQHWAVHLPAWWPPTLYSHLVIAQLGLSASNVCLSAEDTRFQATYCNDQSVSETEGRCVEKRAKCQRGSLKRDWLWMLMHFKQTWGHSSWELHSKSHVSSHFHALRSRFHEMPCALVVTTREKENSSFREERAAQPFVRSPGRWYGCRCHSWQVGPGRGRPGVCGRGRLVWAATWGVWSVGVHPWHLSALCPSWLCSLPARLRCTCTWYPSASGPATIVKNAE